MKPPGPRENRFRSVAVVGAGPSGLAACKSLKEHGVPFTAYEAGERVGGQWVLGNTSGTSVAYRSLQVNTHKEICRYSDFPLPDDAPGFPGHEEMVEYFEAYARHFDIRGRIRFGARVEQATPSESGGYRLQLTGGESVEHDGLVIASGNLWDPRWPEIPGAFDGDFIHARDYMDATDPVDCRGKRVLVMGLGNTACELAVELSAAGAASQVLLSARSGQHIVPKIEAPIPHPSEPPTGLLATLPRPLRNALFRRVFPRVMRRVVSHMPDPQTLGLPPAPATFFEKRMVMNNELFGRLGEGAISARAGVKTLLGNRVEFEDGAVDEVDVIVAATGYRFSLPYLSDDILGCSPSDLELFHGVMHPRRHDLFVIGVMKAICSIWPRSEQQMALVAPLLAGEYALPSQAAIERESYPILGVPFSNCQFYTADLRRELAKGRRRAGRR
ncbi:MAG: NAD(P)-binding domain-containing protein [Myxococcota bacterium]|nr:NAD(P)-binding domain-containing protein [Myxococcota bacterium]